MSYGNLESEYQTAIDSGKINGAIVCATDSKGTFTYSYTIGERTLLSGEKKPHEVDDVLFLASATKLMTTVAALTCVEDGTLSLTGDLSAIAPELAAKQILTGFSDDGAPVLEPQVRPITLAMLLTHSSGLIYHFFDPLISRWRQQFSGERNESNKMTVEELFDYPLTFQPGSEWMYGPSLDWAGRIVERVTGQTLLERLQQRVFGPLGITEAQFYPVTNELLRARMVDLNPEDPGLGRAVLGGDATMNTTTEGDFGGHGLFMTASDYLKVLRSLLANDGTILKPETVDDMFTHHLSPDATADHQAKLAGPMGVFFRVGTAPDSKAGFGLGSFLTLEDVDGWYGDHTLTWGGGQTFSWFIDRQNDLCGVGALQARLPVDASVMEQLKQTFRHDIYHKRQEKAGGKKL